MQKKELDPGKWINAPYAYLLELGMELGSIFTLRYQESEICFLSDLSLIRELGKLRDVVAVEPNKFLHNFVRKTSINLADDENKAVRIQLVPLLNSVDLKTISEVVRRIGPSLLTTNDPTSVKIFPLMEDFTIRLMTELFFGNEAVSSGADSIVKALKQWKTTFSMDFLINSGKESALSPSFFLYGNILKRELELCLERSNNKKTLAGQMLQDFGWDEDRCSAEILSLLLFGHDTLAAQLSWWIVNVAEIGCQNELESEKARESSLKESMRLNPAVTHFTRSARADVKIGGHTIQKGAFLVPLIFLINRNQKIFPEPDTYQWNRFLGSAETASHSLVSFGAQNRLCIGKGFAEKIMLIASEYFLKNYKLKIHSAGKSCSRKFLSTVSPDAKINFRVLS